MWIAAEYQSDEQLAEEISQLLYWTQVLMVGRGLTSKTCTDICEEDLTRQLRFPFPTSDHTFRKDVH